MTERVPTSIADLHHEIVIEFGHVKEAIGEVKVLAEKTNGSVQELRLQQAFMKGGLAVLGVLVGSGGVWLVLLSR